MDSVVPTALPPDVDRRRSYLILIWTLIGFSSVFVFARMYMRIFVRKVVGWDDYLISFGWLVQLINNVFATLAVHNGMLIHIYYLTPAEVANTIKWVKATEMCCIIIPVFIKLSVCVSILRLVTVAQRTVTIAICTLMAVLTLTGLATFLVEGMQCLPLKKLWEPEVSGRCISMHTVNWVLVAYGIICVITDFICGIIPILILRRLQMDKSTKIALCLLLGLVLVPGICSIFRTIDSLALNNPDVTWAISGVATWVCLEIEIGFMIACLPMLWSPAAAAGKATSSYFSLWRSDYRSWRAWRSGQLRLGSDESAQTEKSEAQWASLKHDRYGFQQLQRSEGSSGPSSPQQVNVHEDLAPLNSGAHGIVCRKDLDVFTSQGPNVQDLEAASVRKSRGLGMSWA